MNDVESLALVAEQLAAQTVLRGRALDDAVAFAHDRSRWRALVPLGTIEGAALPPAAAQRSEAEIERAVDSFHREGWFALPSLLDAAEMDRRRRIVETLVANGWPPVFGFVFDEFWNLLRAPEVRGVIERLLGPGYRQNGSIWAHRVAARTGASGWAPHVDDPKAAPGKMVAIWVPTSAATLESGCMSIIPRGVLGETYDRAIRERGALPFDDWLEALRAARPLPAPPGSVMGWDGGVLHWGGAWRGGDAPRLSIALEFEAADLPRKRGDISVDPSAPLIPFEERLRCIGTALTAYSRFEPHVQRFATLGERLNS